MEREELEISILLWSAEFIPLQRPSFKALGESTAGPSIPRSSGLNSALVRLRAGVHRRVKVPLWWSFPPVTESNCVVVRRGGEQLEVNG